MTGQLQTRLGGLTATRALRDGASVDLSVDLSNVIPFTRARRAGAEPSAPPVTINPADRPARIVPPTRSWLQALLLLISLIAHGGRSEEHTSELQSRPHLVCRLLLEKK